MEKKTFTGFREGASPLDIRSFPAGVRFAGGSFRVRSSIRQFVDLSALLGTKWATGVPFAEKKSVFSNACCKVWPSSMPLPITDYTCYSCACD